MRFHKSSVFFTLFYKSLYNYPVPSNLNFLWNFGVISGILLAVQIVTGILLACHYNPDVTTAFWSIQNIMRNVDSGWLIRYVHLNGASMFFLAVYIHVFRGLYYKSYLYPRELVWLTGVIIFFLMILTAFLGYVLPWGQMSFWAATVITNLVSAVPVIGNSLLIWLWGGFAVGNATLHRFFVLHFLLPFVIALLALVHLVFLHEYGSSNPVGVSAYTDRIPFTPYFTLKDLLGLQVFYFCLFHHLLFLSPNYLNHFDNYIPANPLATPPHIVPEWYFLVFYAILRSVPDKFFGVFLMVLSIVCLALLPFIRISSNHVQGVISPLVIKENFQQIHGYSQTVNNVNILDFLYSYYNRRLCLKNDIIKECIFFYNSFISLILLFFSFSLNILFFQKLVKVFSYIVGHVVNLIFLILEYCLSFSFVKKYFVSHVLLKQKELNLFLSKINVNFGLDFVDENIKVWNVIEEFSRLFFFYTYRISVILFLINGYFLGVIGAHHVITPVYEAGQLCTVFYFFYFFNVLFEEHQLCFDSFFFDSRLRYNFYYLLK